MKLKKRLTSHAVNLLGWRTKRKIVVFESDDWGMIRMASKKAYERLLKKGYTVDQCLYNRFDSLESNEDLEQLMEVLNSVKDQHGKPAKFTLNTIVANPDFEKIEKENYQSYHFQPFTVTLNDYPGRDQVMELYREGIDIGLFRPQFHGREHININRWLSAIQSGEKPLKDAFSERMYSVATGTRTHGRREYLDSFGEAYVTEFEQPAAILQSGASLFQETWGYISKSFIAPCYTWSSSIEPVLSSCGIQYIQGTHVQRVPVSGLELQVKKKYHYLGQKNFLGQRYLVRNVTFEPVVSSSVYGVAQALKEIDLAFRYRKPAIICSHRVNYMGSLHPENRKRNLKKLKSLLEQLIKKHPQVEFMSSDQLGTLLETSN